MVVEVVTFGCRLNAYESEVIRENALKATLGDAIVFNTCAVTAEAERQARQAIRRARRENPNAKIIVTGCSAQIHPQEYGQMPEVDMVIGNEEKLKPESFLFSAQGTERILVNDIMSVRETAAHLITNFEGRTRAFVQVQNGCDHRCTFCIIPYGRGNSRSVPVGEIISHVRVLVEHGYKEVVLTGVDISDYGKDLPGQPTLGQMMRRVLALVPELPRLRLSSIDVAEVDADIYRLMEEEPRLMPHMHISLQAGDDMILKRMKRRHSRQDALDFCAKVRAIRPDVAFGADIITGFPTETEEMFTNTLRLVEEAELTYLHVFPYSARKGTPAARMPQVQKEVRKERAARLRELGKRQEQKLYSSFVGRQVSAITELGGIARTDNFVPVKLMEEIPAGRLVTVRISAKNNNELQGSVIA